MSTEAQETAGPQESSPIFLQNINEAARKKSLQLLKHILPEQSWIEFEKKGIITIKGQHGKYVIFPFTQTEICDFDSNKCKARACLQFSIPTPIYDRMIAEYLLIKNDENFYWKTANIFIIPRNGDIIATLLLITINIILFGNIFVEIISTVR